jgi:2-keto-4-pentenoate hydratase
VTPGPSRAPGPGVLASSKDQTGVLASIKDQSGRPSDIGERGRFIYGPTAPSTAVPCPRTSALSPAEIDEVVDIIAGGRAQRRAVELPERLQTRNWESVMSVVMKLDERRGRRGVGWKIGAASQDIRRAEGLPGPSPGRIYEGTVFSSGASLGPEYFINYRNIECEFAFRLGLDFPVRDEEYTEADAGAAIDTLCPVLELGDTVFLDWYGASSYFGSCLDNGGGAALIQGTIVSNWRDVDLVSAGMDLYLNGWYIKSGQGRAAMGHPVTSLTWMINWARAHGRAVPAGEVVSTGTCTGHCFASSGDVASADFGPLGRVEVSFT